MGKQMRKVSLVFLSALGLVVSSLFLGGMSSAIANSNLSSSSERNLSQLNEALAENSTLLADRTFQINFATRIVSLNAIKSPNLLVPQTLIATNKNTQQIFMSYDNNTVTFGDTSKQPTHSIDEEGTMLVDLEYALKISDVSEEEKSVIIKEAEEFSGDSKVLLVYEASTIEFPYIEQLYGGSVFVVESSLPQNIILENTRNASIKSSKLKNGSTRYTVIEEPLRTKLDGKNVSQTRKVFTFNKRGYLTKYDYYVNNVLVSTTRIVLKTTLLPLEGDMYMPDEFGLIPADEDAL